MTDFDGFRDAVLERVQPGDDCVAGPELVLDTEAQAVVDAAVALAVQRHDETAHGMHLLATISQAGGALEALLTQFGAEMTHFNSMVDSVMQYDNAV